MKPIKGTQDHHELGIRLFLDRSIFGARSIEVVVGKWWAGIEWSATKEGN